MKKTHRVHHRRVGPFTKTLKTFEKSDVGQVIGKGVDKFKEREKRRYRQHQIATTVAVLGSAAALAAAMYNGGGSSTTTPPNYTDPYFRIGEEKAMKNKKTLKEFVMPMAVMNHYARKAVARGKLGSEEEYTKKAKANSWFHPKRGGILDKMQRNRIHSRYDNDKEAIVHPYYHGAKAGLSAVAGYGLGASIGSHAALAAHGAKKAAGYINAGYEPSNGEGKMIREDTVRAIVDNISADEDRNTTRDYIYQELGGKVLDLLQDKKRELASAIFTPDPEAYEAQSNEDDSEGEE